MCDNRHSEFDTGNVSDILKDDLKKQNNRVVQIKTKCGKNKSTKTALITDVLQESYEFPMKTYMFLEINTMELISGFWK